MESLLLFCRALSSPTMCRFSPALSVPGQSSQSPEGNTGELRLRVGDYRVRFIENPPGTLYIHAVLHRSEAYR